MGHSCSLLQQLACKLTKSLPRIGPRVARCVVRPLASISSSRDEVTGGFAAAAHREPIAGSISSRLSFQLSRLLNVLLQPVPLHRSSFSSSSMLLCERVALPACVVSSLQVWHILRILALLASASIIVALGRVATSHTAVHMPPARWFSRGALGWPLCSHPLHRPLSLRGLVPCAHWAIFKRLSLGGYGDLTCIKSIWIDSSSLGDKILRLVMSNGHVYSRVAPVNMANFP